LPAVEDLSPHGRLLELFSATFPGGASRAIKQANPREAGTREKMMNWPMPQPLPVLCDGPVDNEVRAQVWGLLSAIYHRNELPERRHDTRYPFPCLIYLTPLSTNGAATKGETVVVVGRDLSERGLGFYHRDPLPYRRVIASFQTSNGRWFAFLTDLNWCRFTKGGWYESGGRFLETALSPLEE
jgi:hypothetical protein